MALTTDGLNVKAMFFGVAEMVMVLLCWSETIITSKSRRARNFASSNSVVYSVTGLAPFRIFGKTTFIYLFCCYLALFALPVSLSGIFAIFCFAIFALILYAIQFRFGASKVYFAVYARLPYYFFSVSNIVFVPARFASFTVSVFASPTLMKFRDRFDLLTSAASFRHILNYTLIGCFVNVI